MKSLVLATRNKDKIEELKHLLEGLDFDIQSLEQFPQVTETVEDADTLEGNALKKAREAFRATQVLSLADDTGLEVGYLLGAPGVFSSRYAGPKVSYAENRTKLLKDLHGVPARKRRARFRCVIAIVGPGNFERTVEGIVPGTIREEPAGAGGFGYDPLFVPQGYSKTFAEMDPLEKNHIKIGRAHV